MRVELAFWGCIRYSSRALCEETYLTEYFRSTFRPPSLHHKDMAKPQIEQTFLMDIEAIRKRARQHMEKGAVTDDYKADLPTVLRVLNEALATEIVCVLRYKRHQFMASGLSAQ